MSDDFIDDEFIEEEERASSNGPFLMAVGALFLIFIFAGACTLFFLLQNGDNGETEVANSNSEEIAARETENAMRIATNTAVAVFIAETETAQAQPTEPPAATATATTPPTETPVPTNTPVVKAGDEEGSSLDEALGSETEAADDEETGAAAGGAAEDAGAEAAGDDETAAAAVTPIPAAAPADTEALPQTGGLNTSLMLGIGLLLIVLLFVVRRLRLSS